MWFKHVPLYSEVMQKSDNGDVLSDGEHGVLQFISPIPHSYQEMWCLLMILVLQIRINVHLEEREQDLKYWED